ncbi:MAG: GDP-mannose 4,6-dehydratase [Magnetococcales bacterium]|nr:GDP-mannose 4,6-dehydratase [Magnetococcales bacterium]
MMHYNKSRVLITGGMGFIGSRLARRLVHLGAKVTIVDNLLPLHGSNPFNIQDFESAVSINICDVREQQAMNRFIKKNDFLFNLAAQTSHTGSMTDPTTDMAINVSAQLGLLESCRKWNPRIRVVYASTRQVYGKPQYLPVDENHPIQPTDINGIHKATSESYYALYHTIYGLHTCVLRLTNTYGPGMRIQDAQQCFLGLWFRLLMEQKPIPIFGDGEQRRDFNYVEDCVDALLLAGSRDKANGKVYNLGSREVISLNRLAATMVKLSGRGSYECIPFPDERKQIDIGDYYGDFSRISRELKWQPKVTLDAGLTKTMAYYQRHFRHYLMRHSVPDDRVTEL